mmetsp:Transcript_58433/g.152145  ORF Transcript_58433/g.152145 Transcript_58433/m.152145 type:complete len:260 (-) Transcript_58433:201-980(-)
MLSAAVKQPGLLTHRVLKLSSFSSKVDRRVAAIDHRVLNPAGVHTPCAQKLAEGLLQAGFPLAAFDVILPDISAASTEGPESQTPEVLWSAFTSGSSNCCSNTRGVAGGGTCSNARAAGEARYSGVFSLLCRPPSDELRLLSLGPVPMPLELLRRSCGEAHRGLLPPPAVILCKLPQQLVLQSPFSQIGRLRSRNAGQGHLTALSRFHRPYPPAYSLFSNCRSCHLLGRCCCLCRASICLLLRLLLPCRFWRAKLRRAT